MKDRPLNKQHESDLQKLDVDEMYNRIVSNETRKRSNLIGKQGENNNDISFRYPALILMALSFLGAWWSWTKLTALL